MKSTLTSSVWMIHNLKGGYILEVYQGSKKRKTKPRFFVRKRSRIDLDIIVTFVLMSNKPFQSKMCILDPPFCYLYFEKNKMDCSSSSHANLL